MLKVLLSPFGYYRIRHPQKMHVDIVLPAIAATLSTMLVIWFGGNGALTRPGGLVSGLFEACAILPGFYIAALSAVATMRRPGLDDLILPPTPTISQVENGVADDVGLTRRRFLAMLFAFLAAQSLALLVLYLFVALIGPQLSTMVPDVARSIVRGSVAFVCTFLFWQLVSVTFLGLYYLGERLYRPGDG